MSIRAKHRRPLSRSVGNRRTFFALSRSGSGNLAGAYRHALSKAQQHNKLAPPAFCGQAPFLLPLFFLQEERKVGESLLSSPYLRRVRMMRPPFFSSLWRREKKRTRRARTSSQAPYHSPRPQSGRAHSLRCSSSPHKTRFAGLLRGPRKEENAMLRISFT